MDDLNTWEKFFKEEREEEINFNHPSSLLFYLNPGELIVPRKLIKKEILCNQK